MSRLILLVGFLGSFVLAQAQDVLSQLTSKTDTQAEIEWGRAFYEQEVLKSGRLSRNEAYHRRVQRLLDQLQSVMPSRPYPFQAVVVADNDVNAGCYPGGYMLVNEGLLVKMPSDHELAFTLAHEIGHAVRRHWARKLRIQQTDVLTDILLRVLTNNRASGGDNTLRFLAYNRGTEDEADAFGTELYLRAGFPADRVGDGMRVLIEMMKGPKGPEYLQTHPFPENRLTRILDLSKKLLSSGLKPTAPGEPVDVSVRSVFGDLPSVAAEGSELLPFKPGTVWTYSVQSAAGSTTYTTNVASCADVLSSKVARFETKVGERAVGFQVMADGSRIFRRNRPDKADSKWVIELVIPEYGGSEEAEGVLYRHAGFEAVQTPAGVFPDSVKIEMKDPSGRIVHSWYTQGVGLVKRINTATNVTETLIRYRRG